MSDRIEEIRARCEAAISGEWTVATHQEYYGQGYGETTFFVDMGEGALLKIGVANESESFERLCALSAFIANAREDVPFLLDEIDRLKMMLDAAAAGQETMQRKTAERNENLRLDYLDAVAERDAAIEDLKVHGVKVVITA